MTPLIIGIVIVIGTVLIVKALGSSESKSITTILNWFPAILFAYVIPAGITHTFGLDLASIELHQWSKNIIMPLAILTVMSALSFSQLKHIGWRPIMTFFSGSMMIALMPIAIGLATKYIAPDVYDTFITEGYWQGMITMVGSWIGGSTSQLVLKELSDCSEELFITILVMDNVLVNLWTILMFQFIKRSDGWNSYFKIEDKVKDFVPDQVDIAKSPILTLSAIALIIIASYFLIPNFLMKIIFLSIAGLLLGNFINSWNHALVLKIGGILIILIMAILGLKLNFENFGLPISMIILSIGWLISHYLIMILVAWKLKLHMAWLPIASMANVGGISTAPAVTAAYNEEWMPHAIILAILSMVTGTTWGMISIYLMKSLVL